MKKSEIDMIGDMLAKGMNIRADIVPVIGEDDEDVLLSTDGIEAQMPVLPVMEQVLFPGVLTPIAARVRVRVNCLKM